MSQHDTTVALYSDHAHAEEAVRKLGEQGFDMKQFSIVGRGYHTEEAVIGFYDAGDRIKFWGSRGAYWGGLWGVLFGGMMLTLPLVGPVMVLGPLAAAVFAAVAGGVEGALSMGALGALGAALFSIGIPKHSIIDYETALKADKFLLVAHGSVADMERVRHLLGLDARAKLDVHPNAPPPLPLAA